MPQVTSMQNQLDQYDEARGLIANCCFLPFVLLPVHFQSECALSDLPVDVGKKNPNLVHQKRHSWHSLRNVDNFTYPKGKKHL